jgi:hypothetical protein
MTKKKYQSINQSINQSIYLFVSWKHLLGHRLLLPELDWYLRLSQSSASSNLVQPGLEWWFFSLCRHLKYEPLASVFFAYSQPGGVVAARHHHHLLRLLMAVESA